MKTTILFLVILLAFRISSTIGQVAMLSPFVISSSGGFYSHPGGSYSTTVGEMSMVKTFHNATFLTQGFQQPVPDIISGIGEIHNGGLEIRIFPNPATSQLSVLIHSRDNAKYHLGITDVLGKKIYSSDFYASSMDAAKNIDVNDYAVGVYIITIESSNNAFVNVLRFIKN